ncbi:hypothetical protein LOTGIDRAFT_235599 [Lottia gigantea]|uniref:Uncharacterized protein n=1 Tax=Lottia gigantea TaxID=225164 RepID=V3ZYE1_LOTGI|nr:hypothetical protein LOTGIDRAFT_235599 [Lottia gigantea]ESO86001.1 hypothetical protein LOTGIDRAFT_235599 [Lottia gigantea]
MEVQNKKRTTGVKGKGKGKKTKTETKDTEPSDVEPGTSKQPTESKQDVSVDMDGPSVAIDLEDPQVQDEKPEKVKDDPSLKEQTSEVEEILPDENGGVQTLNKVSSSVAIDLEDPQVKNEVKEKDISPVKTEVVDTLEENDYEIPVITVEQNQQVKTTQQTEQSSEKQETESIDFSSINPEDYGLKVEDDDLPADFIYEPPPQTDLPDLYNLLASLEEGNGDLVTKDPPPSLFAIPEHIPSYSKISELRYEIEKGELQPYISRFDTDVKDDVVLLGKISLEEVQEEEKRLRDEHILYLEQESRLAREREEKLINREEQAKTRMATFVKDKRGDLARREELLRQKEKLMLDHVHKAFRRAESQLIGTLERRKGEVKTLYGDLMLADGQYGGSKGRRWKVDWNRTPQPIKINLKCIRGVKDKLPGGRYVMMASLYNRLGGHTMRWSKLKGQTWGGTTLPMFHEGNFYNTEMKINQSLFTVLPAKPSLRPGMILVFELFLLRGSVLPVDKVVAWGCFPICDGNFDVLEGKYKCSMLRSEMNLEIDKHEKMEELISSDINHWLSNLYFEVIKLPRYLAGQNEHEVELQFSSKLTNFPDRVQTGWDENKDGSDPIPGSVTDMGSASSSGTPSGSSGVISTNDTIVRSEATTSKVKLHNRHLQIGTTSRSSSTNIGSRIIKKDTRRPEDDDGDVSSEEEDEVKAIRRQGDFRPHQTMPGVYYKQYLNNPADEYFKRMYTMLPRTSVLAPRLKKKKLTHVEELEEHSFSVQAPFTGKGRFHHSGREKMGYIARQFLAEIGMSQWRSREFWGMLLLFLIFFFLRFTTHYFGQWLFLSALGIPINKFDFRPYTVDLNYQPTLLRTREEIGVVVLGPMMNILLFTLMVIFAWICPKIFGFFPDLFSKFVLTFGVLTFLDPLLILIVDCAMLRFYDQSTEPIADFAKLWWHFSRSQGSGLAGVFITLFLYTFVGLLSSSILYMYFLRLHNNGRMLDIFWRLHGKEENFFIPYDLEMSNEELAYVCHKAEMWRGEEGERRKVAVYDYIWEEEEVEESIWDENGVEKLEKKEGRKEVTTHVSIHTLHLDGLRELYRHFLRLPDGAIVEVFGDVSIPGMDKDMKTALEQGSKNLENLMGSQLSMSKVRGRQTVITRAGFTPGQSSPTPSETPSTSPSTVSSIEKKKIL